jgi:hypothetical protein
MLENSKPLITTLIPSVDLCRYTAALFIKIIMEYSDRYKLDS